MFFRQNRDFIVFFNSKRGRNLSAPTSVLKINYLWQLKCECDRDLLQSYLFWPTLYECPSFIQSASFDMFKLDNFWKHNQSVKFHHYIVLDYVIKYSLSRKKTSKEVNKASFEILRKNLPEAIKIFASYYVY